MKRCVKQTKILCQKSIKTGMNNKSKVIMSSHIYSDIIEGRVSMKHIYSKFTSLASLNALFLFLAFTIDPHPKL